VACDHITDTLASFHWLKSPELIQHKLIAGDRLSFTELYGPRAPSLYLAADLWRLFILLKHLLHTMKKKDEKYNNQKTMQHA